MSIVKLGTKLKISYEAQNQKSGLLDITVKIEKPDGSILGTFPMVESSDNGFYRYERSTLGTDPEGDYICIINSPSEFKSKTHLKVTMLNVEGGGTGEGTVILTRGFVVGEISSNNLMGHIDSNLLKGQIEKEGSFGVGVLKSTTLNGSISNKFLTSYSMETKNG